MYPPPPTSILLSPSLYLTIPICLFYLCVFLFHSLSLYLPFSSIYPSIFPSGLHFPPPSRGLWIQVLFPWMGVQTCVSQNSNFNCVFTFISCSSVKLCSWFICYRWTIISLKLFLYLCIINNVFVLLLLFY